MKKVFSYLLIISLFAISCQEKTSIVETANQVTPASESIPPLKFSSIDELQNTIYGIRDAASIIEGTKAAFPVSDFVSYAETVMQEDGYDDRPNAICSDAFGSILNPDGEVVFGDYVLKVCDRGILYSFKRDIDKIRDIAEEQELSMRLVGIPSSEFIIPTDVETGTYKIADEDGIYFYDTFGLLSVEDDFEKATSDDIQTKATVIWAQEGTKTGSTYDREYVWPKSQKNTFPSNSKVANDTKIYKQNFVVYSEAGVKTKTMKKKGLIWNKFDANVTSGISDILIHEGGYKSVIGNCPEGWLDINTANYPGQSFVIATKVVGKSSQIPTANSSIASDCDKAIAWAKSNGKTIDKVDGVRYIANDMTEDTIVRLKDIVSTKYDSKNTIIFNLKTESGSFSTSNGTFGKFKVNNGGCRVDLITFYGYSEYNNECRGSILKCARF